MVGGKFTSTRNIIQTFSRRIKKNSSFVMSVTANSTSNNLMDDASMDDFTDTLIFEDDKSFGDGLEERSHELSSELAQPKKQKTKPPASAPQTPPPSPPSSQPQQSTAASDKRPRNPDKKSKKPSKSKKSKNPKKKPKKIPKKLLAEVVDLTLLESTNKNNIRNSNYKTRDIRLGRKKRRKRQF